MAGEGDHPEALAATLGRLDPGLPLADLLRFRADLLAFNRSRNLVSRRDAGRQVDRLLLESVGGALLLAPSPDAVVLDIGTGGGIPGLPFALVHPRTRVYLLDRRPVACGFVRRQILQLGLSHAEVLEGQTREVLGRDLQPASVDWILMKAVAPPPRALELGRRFLRPEGRVCLWREEGYEPEPELERRGWSRERTAPLPGFDPGPGRPALQIFRRS